MRRVAHSLPSLLGILLLAASCWAMSQELSHTFSSVVLFGVLLAYRAIYYLIPLAIAVMLLGSYEVYQWQRSPEVNCKVDVKIDGDNLRSTVNPRIFSMLN